MKNKNIRIYSSYELNRLAEQHLSDSYEKLFPTIKQKINRDKKTQNNVKKQNYLKQIRGKLK